MRGPYQLPNMRRSSVHVVSIFSSGLGCFLLSQEILYWLFRCPSSRRCVGMDTYMISFPYGQCQSWITAANTQNACQLGALAVSYCPTKYIADPYDCEVQKTCTECQSVGPRCGWCDDGSGTGLGRCIPGSDSGPLVKDNCPAKSWYFTGQPSMHSFL